MTSGYGRARPPARRGSLVVTGWRWLTGLHPLHSWLLVMAVVVALSMVGLRMLALLIAVGWTGYAAWTWLSPTARLRLRRGRGPGRR